MLRELTVTRKADAFWCGNKAATLGELQSRGYLVPAGLVLTTAVYDAFLRQHGLRTLVNSYEHDASTAIAADLCRLEREISAAFRGAGLPPELGAAIERWRDMNRVESCAVRSSATAEDLADAAFAGQYSSFLNVGRFDLETSILQCWASLFGARVGMYRQRKERRGIGAMAVLVQQMVAAEHAGVIVTREPRRQDCLLMECAPGLGEAVVSGTVTPNRYSIDRATLQVRAARVRHEIPMGELLMAARTALDIENALGDVQDIEYAVASGRVYVLQARVWTGAGFSPVIQSSADTSQPFAELADS